MSTLYFDTSAINRLTDEPNRSSLLAVLSRNTCAISIFTIAELASTTSPDRRSQLLRTVKELIGDYRPLEMPGELLKRATRALLNNQATMDLSMGPEWNGLLVALNDPTSIDDITLAEAQRWKAKQEQWYNTMHNNARPHIQAELSTLSDDERKWISGYPSRLLKHFSHNIKFLTDVVCDLSPSELSISKEIARTILDKLDYWRFFLAGMAYGMYCRTVKLEGFGWQSNAGSIDTQQSIYLTACDQFVTTDEAQHAMIRTIIPYGIRRRTVWHFDRLRKESLGVASSA